MIDLIENIEIVPEKELKQENHLLVEKIYLAPVINISKKNIENKKRKTEERKIPLCKWTMPPQPQGYMKFRKHDLL
jgi:hypothetical protein